MENLNTLAFKLVEGLASAHHPEYGFGSMTCAVYDTAWLSMVAKPAKSNNWLFPSSFQKIVDTQKLDTGGWVEPGDTDTDIILNTAAALLSLCKHHGMDGGSGLESRITAAASFLRDRLRIFSLDPRAPLPVGFELLLPTLMELLGLEEVSGMASFHFPAQESLMKLREKKLARIDLSRILIAKRQSSLLHSLEAFTGRVDFDSLSGNTVMGSMMASPAATAAVLINASKWNDDCEQYLRYVLDAGSGQRDGGVPSAFPSTYFETSWVTATLLESGFSVGDLGRQNLDILKKILEDGFVAGAGRIGFARHLEPDGDDTAKATTVLNLLGTPKPAGHLIKMYCGGSHFLTYEGEREASLTTNCNILTALCICPGPQEHVREIEVAMKFICRTWWKNTDSVRDKWSTTQLYSFMFTAQSLVRALHLWADGCLSQMALDVVEDAMIVLLQLLVRLLSTQSPSGLWEEKQEPTAYSVLALCSIASLPVVGSAPGLVEKIDQALGAARLSLSKGIETLSKRPAERLWIEKVTYGSQNLSQAYTLAALKAIDRISSTPAETALHGSSFARNLELLPASLDDILKPSKFFSQLPIFANMAGWCMQASLIEGSLFQRRLRNECLRVFPEKITAKEKHLVFIPFTWTSVNNLYHGALGSHAMYEMMVLSALAYQVDEFIEGEVAKLASEALVALKRSIGTLVMELETEHELSQSSQSGLSNNSAQTKGMNGHVQNGEDRDRTGQAISSSLRQTIERFMSFVLNAPHAHATTAYSRAQLKNNLRDYLVAHITQIEASRRLGQQNHEQPQEDLASRHNTFANPGSSLLTWTRTISGDHTVGSLAVAVLICVLGYQKDANYDPIGSPQAKYIASDMARHLAAVARLYNDVGSMKRDHLEGNLNSADFPEFERLAAYSPDEGKRSSTNVRSALLEVAQYEERRLKATMAELKELVENDIFLGLEALCAATQLYCQMYVLKDMTPGISR